MRNKDSQLQIRVNEKEKAWIAAQAKRCGISISAWVLKKIKSEESYTFMDILSRLNVKEPEENRSVLAELSDWLVSIPRSMFLQELSVPPGELPPLLLNQIAAMVEVAAEQKGERIPRWSRDIRPLSEPWFASTLQSLREYLLTRSPVAFKRRNLFVDSTIGGRV